MTMVVTPGPYGEGKHVAQGGRCLLRLQNRGSLATYQFEERCQGLNMAVVAVLTTIKACLVSVEDCSRRSERQGPTGPSPGLWAKRRGLSKLLLPDVTQLEDMFHCRGPRDRQTI